MALRLHVIGLPHVSTTKEYSCDAYEEKCRKFATMMTRQGHEVFLYGGPKNEAECTEFIPCITKASQKKHGFNGPEDYLKIDFNSKEPWNTFNRRVIHNLKKRIQPKDILCFITGDPTKPIAEAFPNNLAVEFGIGYSGICHPFRVFESYAWRNYVYGYHKMDGAFFDTVIPNYFEINDFPLITTKDDYFLFIGRINANKGLNIAQEVCKHLHKRLIVAGPGEFNGYGEYVGVVGPEERAKLMGSAKAVFVPTLYIPPFEGVHIEANLCGTPVISTDFGVFSDTITNDFNGWRCTTFQEFIDAVQKADDMLVARYKFIRQVAVSIYSTEVVAKMYEEYFIKLSTLYDKGWYQLNT